MVPPGADTAQVQYQDRQTGQILEAPRKDLEATIYLDEQDLVRKLRDYTLCLSLHRRYDHH